VVVADDAVISMGSTLLTHQSVGNRPQALHIPNKAQPLRIGARAYIGAHAVVLPGCQVGEEAVVGAGAVVTRPVPARSVVQAIPARIVRNDGCLTNSRSGA
jgi:acetyltransferase-like isoleucine patch superfamily enzyme